MSAATLERTFTTGEAAAELGVREWRLLSLFKRRLLKEPRRHGAYRVLTQSDLDAARAVLARLEAARVD